MQSSAARRTRAVPAIAVFAVIAMLSHVAAFRPVLLLAVPLAAACFIAAQIPSSWALCPAAVALAFSQWARANDRQEFVSASTAAAAFLGVWLLLPLCARVTSGWSERLMAIGRARLIAIGRARLMVLPTCTLIIMVISQLSAPAFMLSVAGSGLLFTKTGLPVEAAVTAAGVLALVASGGRLAGHSSVVEAFALPAVGLLAAALALAPQAWRDRSIGRLGVSSFLFLLGHGLTKDGHGRGAAVMGAYFLCLGLLVMWRAPWQLSTGVGAALFAGSVIAIAIGSEAIATALATAGLFFIFAGCVLSLCAEEITQLECDCARSFP